MRHVYILIKRAGRRRRSLLSARRRRRRRWRASTPVMHPPMETGKKFSGPGNELGFRSGKLQRSNVCVIARGPSQIERAADHIWQQATTEVLGLVVTELPSTPKIKLRRPPPAAHIQITHSNAQQQIPHKGILPTHGHMTQHESSWKGSSATEGGVPPQTPPLEV